MNKSNQPITIQVFDTRHVQSLIRGPEAIKLFFMLNSAEYEIFPAHKC